MTERFVSATCHGEYCFCGKPAAGKVGEEIPTDHPNTHRHNLTAYVCADHFDAVLGRKSWPTTLTTDAFSAIMEMSESNENDSDEIREMKMKMEMIGLSLFAQSQLQKTWANQLFDKLSSARTTISLTRTNIMCEITAGRDKWDGVPELLKKAIDDIDQTIEQPSPFLS